MFHPLCFDGNRYGNETDVTCIAGSVNQTWSDFVPSGFDPVRSFPKELFVEIIELLERRSKTDAVNKIPGNTIALRIRTRCSRVAATRVAVKRRRCALLMQRAQLMFRNFLVPTW